MTEQMNSEDPRCVRAAAHSIPYHRLRLQQRWQRGVTDEVVAMVMFALEDGAAVRRTFTGRWTPDTRTMPWPIEPSRLWRPNLTAVIDEMIRTGLMRHVVVREQGNEVDYLIPAPVHLMSEAGLSACLFVGEDMGPMRSRLVRDLTLVDCLDCEATVARGHARGL